MKSRAAWSRLFAVRTGKPRPAPLRALPAMTFPAIPAPGNAPAADHFTAELPLPPLALSPNMSGGLHWATKHRATVKYRRACWFAIWTVKPRGWVPCRVVIDMEYRCPRGSDGYIAYDEANAKGATKAAVDALQDAGIIDTDSHLNLTWGAFRLITQAAAMRGKTPGVTLTVRGAS